MIATLTPSRPRRRHPEWTEDLDRAFGDPAEVIRWESAEPPAYLLAPAPWSRGAFVIDPETHAGPL